MSRIEAEDFNGTNETSNMLGGTIWCGNPEHGSKITDGCPHILSHHFIAHEATLANSSHHLIWSSPSKRRFFPESSEQKVPLGGKKDTKKSKLPPSNMGHRHCNHDAISEKVVTRSKILLWLQTLFFTSSGKDFELETCEQDKNCASVDLTAKENWQEWLLWFGNIYRGHFRWDSLTRWDISCQLFLLSVYFYLHRSFYSRSPLVPGLLESSAGINRLIPWEIRFELLNFCPWDFPLLFWGIQERLNWT